jgi:hypothetical protein
MAHRKSTLLRAALSRMFPARFCGAWPARPEPCNAAAESMPPPSVFGWHFPRGSAPAPGWSLAHAQSETKRRFDLLDLLRA